MPRISSIGNFSNFTGVYCFGFQRQEQDEELWEGSVSFKYRVEDPRLGRFFSVDPLRSKFPWNSNYAFSENNVVASLELEGLEQIDYREKRVDNVTVGLDVVATNDPTNSNTPINSTSRINYSAIGGGQVSPTGTSLGSTPGIGVRAQDIVNDVVSSGNVAFNAELNNVTGSGNVGPGSSRSGWFDNPNQFNVGFSVTNNGGADPAPGQIQGVVTSEIINPGAPGTPVNTISPYNVSRVLILTNGSASANLNAIAEANALRMNFPNVQFAVAADPVAIGNAAASVGSTMNANSCLIYFNPTGEMAPSTGGFGFGSIPATNFLIPFATPLLPVQPLIPLQDNTATPVGLNRR